MTTREQIEKAMTWIVNKNADLDSAFPHVAAQDMHAYLDQFNIHQIIKSVLQQVLEDAAKREPCPVGVDEGYAREEWHKKYGQYKGRAHGLETPLICHCNNGKPDLKNVTREEWEAEWIRRDGCY